MRIEKSVCIDDVPIYVCYCFIFMHIEIKNNLIF